MHRRFQGLILSQLPVNVMLCSASIFLKPKILSSTGRRFYSFGEDGFRSIYAPHQQSQKVEETKRISNAKSTEDPSQSPQPPIPGQMPNTQHDASQITAQSIPSINQPPPPYHVYPQYLPHYVPIASNPADVPLREICSFLALSQYCSDHNLRFLLLLVGGLSCGLIDLWTSALYLGVIDENKFIPAAFLFYLFGLCNGRALFAFIISILLYKLPSHLSFIVQDERGISTRPSAIRWRVGKYEISSSILFSIAVAVSFVRLTIPLQLFFARMVFSV